MVSQPSADVYIKNLPSERTLQFQCVWEENYNSLLSTEVAEALLWPKPRHFPCPPPRWPTSIFLLACHASYPWPNWNGTVHRTNRRERHATLHCDILSISTHSLDMPRDDGWKPVDDHTSTRRIFPLGYRIDSKTPRLSDAQADQFVGNIAP